MRSHLALLVALLTLSGVLQAQKPRERDLKLPIGGTAGPLDAITDVAGVEVGHTTLISGSGKLVVGQGPVRTGVTDRASARPGQQRSRVRRVVHAERQRRDDRHDLDSGERVARGAGCDHQHAQRRRGARRDHSMGGLAARTSCNRGGCPSSPKPTTAALNDINGFHVKPEHVLAALDGAAGGRAEGRRGRRRHRHGVPRLQGRHRHRVAEAA